MSIVKDPRFSFYIITCDKCGKTENRADRSFDAVITWLEDEQSNWSQKETKDGFEHICLTCTRILQTSDSYVEDTNKEELIQTLFNGDLVNLRECRKEDIPFKQEYWNDPEIRSLCSYSSLPFTLQDEEKWFSEQTKDKDNYSFTIEARSEMKCIGECRITGIDWKNGNAMITIFIGDKNYWNRGYGRDALKILIRFIFDELGIYKIKLDVFDFNKRAIKAYEKCGFATEAVFKNELYRAGKYHSILRMTLLNPNFVRSLR